MCGIVGVISAKSNGQSKEENACFRDMLLMDAVRGVDSTGVFTVGSEGDVSLLKSALASGDFVRAKEFNNIHTEMYQDGMFAVGHNRAATRGAITDENAHPFCVNDELILVQNGTMYGGHDHIANVDVDSHALAILLHKEPDIEKALNSINAAFALVWYDVRTTTLNIIRNEERPLHFVNTQDGGVLFASESWIITAAALRNGIKLKGQPYMIKENNLFSLKLDEKNRTYTPSNTPMNILSSTPTSYYSNYTAPSANNHNYSNRNTPKQVEDYIREADPALGHTEEVAVKLIDSTAPRDRNETRYLELYDVYFRTGWSNHIREYVVFWHDVLILPQEKPSIFYYSIFNEGEILKQYGDMDKFKNAMEMVEVSDLNRAWKSQPYQLNGETRHVLLSYVLTSKINPIQQQ